MNESIRGDERLYRCVLAEEIGHYRTTIGDITPRKYMCYSDRLTLDKMELAALRRATDFVIPTEQVISFLKKQKQPTIEMLVDEFFVTHDL